MLNGTTTESCTLHGVSVVVKSARVGPVTKKPLSSNSKSLFEARNFLSPTSLIDEPLSFVGNTVPMISRLTPPRNDLYELPLIPTTAGSFTFIKSTSGAVKKAVEPPTSTRYGSALFRVNHPRVQTRRTTFNVTGVNTYIAPKIENFGTVPIPTARNAGTIYTSPCGTMRSDL